MDRIKNRMNSDTAESLTISQILWIVFTVVIVLAVGSVILKAVTNKGKTVADCINQSNTMFDKVDKKCAGSQTYT